MVHRKRLAQAREILSDLMNIMGCDKRAFEVQIGDLSIEETPPTHVGLQTVERKRRKRKLSKNFHPLLETDSCICMYCRVNYTIDKGRGRGMGNENIAQNRRVSTLTPCTLSFPNVNPLISEHFMQRVHAEANGQPSNPSRSSKSCLRRRTFLTVLLNDSLSDSLKDMLRNLSSNIVQTIAMCTAGHDKVRVALTRERALIRFYQMRQSVLPNL